MSNESLKRAFSYTEHSPKEYAFWTLFQKAVTKLNRRTLRIEGSFTVRLVSCCTGSDSVTILHTNNNMFSYIGSIKIYII